MPASIPPSTSNRIESFRLPAEAGTSAPGATATAGTAGAAGTSGAAGTAGSTGSAAGVVAPTLERPHNAPSSRTSAPLASSGGEELRERRPLPELVGTSPGRSLLDDSHSMSDSREWSSRRLDTLARERGLSGPLSATASDIGRQLRAEPTFNLSRPVAPERNWRSVANAISSEVVRLAGVAGSEVVRTLGSVVPPMPEARLAGVVAGHAIHQTVAVGLPTFAREMLASAVSHALRHTPAPAVMGLQATVGMTNVVLQVVRELRERRNPDEAARAYHSLTPEQWQAKRPDQQKTMRDHTLKVSRLFTVMQVSSSFTNLMLMHHGFQQGDRAAALQPLTNELKVGVYAAMRDGLQASFSMVKVNKPPAPVGGGPQPELAAGMSGAAQASAVATYAGVNVVNNFLGDALKGAWVPDRSAAAAVLLDQSSAMNMGDAWRVAAGTAAISALINTLGETTDWFQRLQLFANQTPGATQEWAPVLTGTDRSRVLDQAQARASLTNTLFSALTAAGQGMAHSQLPPAVQQFIGNVGAAALGAMLDSPITGLWQAQEAVRATPVPDPPVDLELALNPDSPRLPSSSASSVADIPVPRQRRPRVNVDELD